MPAVKNLDEHIKHFPACEACLEQARLTPATTVVVLWTAHDRPDRYHCAMSARNYAGIRPCAAAIPVACRTIRSTPENRELKTKE